MIIVFILIAISSNISAANQVEIRGQATKLSPIAKGFNEFVWNSTNFAGFYYDINENIGTEQLAFNLSYVNPASAILRDQETDGVRGINYTTHSQFENFKFKPWGRYEVIGFLGERYFAAYDNETPNKIPNMANASDDVSFLYNKSKNKNLMINDQISKMLIDSDAETTISSSSSLKLEEGYELAIKSIDIDGKKVHVDLLKDGQVVDSKIVKPSISDPKMEDQTYFFKTNLDETEGVVTIAVHFKNAFEGNDTSIATVDGIFQISETPTPIMEGQQYYRMSIKDVDETNMSITMDNKDNQIKLIKNRDIQLMEDIYIKTSNQDVVNKDNPLRYYIYKKYTEQGTYEQRGSVANLSQKEFAYTSTTFPGFYYDIDNNLGAEQIKFRRSNVRPDNDSTTLGDQPDVTNNNMGIVYTTQAQSKNFKFKSWGQYKVIGFLSEMYFAAYDKKVTQGMNDNGETVAFLFDKSENGNLMTNEQLSKVLIDSDTETSFNSDNPLELGEGYVLAIKSIDVKGDKVYLELSRNGQVVDDKVVQPSKDGATMDDKTFYYSEAIGGDADEIVTIAVHFKDAFSGSGDNSAIVDGIFQISDTPIHLEADQQYDKMSIRKVDPNNLSILMDNKNYNITLSKNKNILLMEDIYNKTANENMTAIYIRTADQESINATNPLRYYIYKDLVIE